MGLSDKIKSIFRKKIQKESLILIVDDGEVERRVLSKTLLNNGFRVATATDGASGIEMAKQRLPDLIIMDFAMPAMSGVEACERIKRDPVLANIPIIFLTGSANSKDLVDCFEVGAESFLEKPISAAMLLKQVNIVLSQMPVKEDI